jgi:SAM-dependent methyltransferase
VSGVHPVASAGFGSAADAYERGRPGYPAAALEWLGERLGIRPGATVVDLAAGTGKLARSLMATGARIVAIEPVEAMRAAIGPGVEALDGTADAMPLPDAAADAVTVAQAFHWFAGEPALREIHRVLRPGGRLALLWNARRMEDPIHGAIEELFAPHYEGVPRHRTGAWRDAFADQDLFGPFEEAGFANEQELDADELVARVGSTSVIAALPEDKRAELLARASALAGTGRVTLRYTCEIHVAARMEQPLAHSPSV